MYWGYLLGTPHAGARPVRAIQKKISRNLLVSYNLAKKVELSLFGIASNRIGLVGTRRVAPCYNFPSRCHRSSLRSNWWIVDREILYSMSVRRSLFAQVLENGDTLLGLSRYLAKKWAFPGSPQDFTASRSLRSNKDSATVSVSNTGFPVLEDLGYLVSRGVEVLVKLTLLDIN